MERIDADSEETVADIIKASVAVEIVGGGSKLGLGRPVEVTRQLSVSGLTGITLYEPAELVMSAKAGTRLCDIAALLTEQGQSLAFEPPDLAPLLGGEPGRQTIGGIVATNLSGPRRCVAGSVRDHLLGLRAVNGRGEIFRAGGRVVKNVTGYDLCKLMTGSFGTMAVFTELTFKVLPAAEAEETFVLAGLDAHAAVRAMCQAMGSSAGISGAAWLPSASGPSLTCLRLEGFAPSVAARRQRLQLLLHGGDSTIWPAEASQIWWRSLGNVQPLAGRTDHAIWKISLAPPQAPSLLDRLTAIDGCLTFLDWGGALLWVSLPCGSDAQAPLLRSLLPSGAYAMLLVAPAAIRARQAVFQPRPAAQATIEERVRQSFDPDHRLNPGRMSAGC